MKSKLKYEGLRDHSGSVLAFFSRSSVGRAGARSKVLACSFPAELSGVLAEVAVGTMCEVEIQQAAAGPAAMRLVSFDPA